MNEDESSILSSDDLFDRLGLASSTDHSVSIVSDIEAQDGTVLNIPITFKIMAVTKGGAKGFKDVTIQIIVCGEETLSLDDVNFATFTLDIPITAPAHEDKSLASFFISTDPDCPAITHTVYSSLSPNLPPTADQLLNFNIVANSTSNYLRVFPDHLAVDQFWIEGRTVSGKKNYKPM